MHVRLGHAGIVDHFVKITGNRLKKKKKKQNQKKEWRETMNIFKQLHKSTMANIVPYGSKLHIPPTKLLIKSHPKKPAS